MTYLQVVAAQQTALDASIALAQARTARLADTAARFQSRGGRAPNG